MKRKVYRASALAGWIGVIVLFVLILSDNALRSAVVAAVSQWPEPARLLLAALGGYLIGSLPIGFLAVGVLTERDVREEGSGRTGGTNAYRAGGFLGGFLTIVGDFLKGMCAVAFGALLLPNIWAPVLSGLGGVLPRLTVRVGGAASEARAREALAAGDLVHMASHGALDPRNPLFSHVALTPSRASPPDDDGRLEVHEILGLRIRSPLVFLSGCQTGLGAAGSTGYAAGEDYTTLAQAFLYAGASGVVSTLWRIEDNGAAVLAERFYRHLATLGPPEALAAAQRDLLSLPRYSAPFYWAGYTFSGGGATQNRLAVSVRP